MTSNTNTEILDQQSDKSMAPIISEETAFEIRWVVRATARDTAWAATFGRLQSELLENSSRAKPKFLVLDMVMCEWMDPIPALSLAITLEEYRERGGEYTVMIPNLAELLKDESESHAAQLRFLKFGATSGFFRIILGRGTITYTLSDGFHPQKNSVGAEIFSGDIPILPCHLEEFAQLPVQLAFEKASSLPMRILRVPTTPDGSLPTVLNRLDEWVESELEEFVSPVVGSMVPTWEQPGIRYRLVFALRELLHNISEHAYTDSGLAGVYIRYREGALGEAPSVWRALAEYVHAEARPANSPLLGARRLSELFPNKRPGFFEVFVVDAGRGICESLGVKNQDGRIRMKEAMHDIFMHSRGRRIERPTQYGGLFLMRDLLSDSLDYIRVFDADAWWGAELPLTEHIEGTESRPQVCINAQRLGRNEPPMKGVAWTLRMSWPERSDSTDSANWKAVDTESLKDYRDQLLQILRSIDATNGMAGIRVIDHRASQYSPRIYDTELVDGHNVLLLLPALRWMKNRVQFEIRKCLERYPSPIGNHLVIAEIASEEARIYLAAIENSMLFTRGVFDRISSITLITIDLRVCRLIRSGQTGPFQPSEAASTRFLIGRQPDQALGALYSLERYFGLMREIDSKAFWNAAMDYTDIFIDAPVLWSNTITLSGYLDFPQCLTLPACRMIFLSSLHRVVGLFPRHSCKLVALDGLVESIVTLFNAQHRPRRYQKTLVEAARETPPLILRIGSVKVSGSTEESDDLLRTDLATVTFHFFRHPSGTAGGRFLLHWRILTDRKDDTTNDDQIPIQYSRIGRTPAIAKGGWKSYQLPRYDLDGESIYEATPRESYRFWQEPGHSPLKLGHWNYGGHHDLITLNLRLAFDIGLIGLTSSSQGSVSEFLFRSFIDILNLKADEFKPEYKQVYYRLVVAKHRRMLGTGINKRYPILVYMSHAVTDRIVDAFLTMISDEKTGIDQRSGLDRVRRKIIGMTPIRRNRHGSGLQVSGLVRDRLIESAREGTAAVIFDDAVITGRTYSDLKGILRSVGITEIESITIVDRQRLPSAHHAAGRRHTCFWRLDVPTMGDGHTCPLCSARNRAEELATNLTSTAHRELLRKWIKMWRPIDPTTEWGDGGLKPIPIRLSARERKFGVEVDINDVTKFTQIGGDGRRISITNSAGLATYVAELHSQTSRDDLGLRFISREQLDPEVRIQLIASQLLLFQGEFDGALALDLGKSLFEALWASHQSDRTSALAFLTFLACGKQFMRASISVLFSEGGRSRHVASKIPEVLLLLAYIRSSSGKSSDIPIWLGRIDVLDGVLEPKGKIEVLEWLHRLVLDGSGKAHSTSLHRFIKTRNRDSIGPAFLSDVLSCVERLGSLVPHVRPYWFSRAARQSTNDPIQTVQSACVRLAGEINRLNAVSDEVAASKNSLALARKWGVDLLDAARGIHTSVFSPIGLQNLRQEGELTGCRVIDKLKELFKSQLGSEKLNNESGQSISFYLPSPGELERQLASFGKLTLDEAYCLWDANVEEALLDIATNRRHASSLITSPWGGRDTRFARIWIRVELSERFLGIQFCNNSNDAVNNIQEANRRISPAKAFLADSGGTIHFEALRSDIVITTVNLPYAHTLTQNEM